MVVIICRPGRVNEGYYRQNTNIIRMISLQPLEARWQHLTIRSKVNIISIIGVQLGQQWEPMPHRNLWRYLTDQGIPRGKTIEPLMMVFLDLYHKKSVGDYEKTSMSRCCILENHSPSHYSQAQNPLVKGKVISLWRKELWCHSLTSDSSMWCHSSNYFPTNLPPQDLWLFTPINVWHTQKRRFSKRRLGTGL